MNFLFDTCVLSEMIKAEPFDERKLSFCAKMAEHWGLMISAMESQGKSMPVIDTLICATAQYHEMVLVTRNTKDFCQCTGFDD